jgi:hypothetical protein
VLIDTGMLAGGISRRSGHRDRGPALLVDQRFNAPRLVMTVAPIVMIPSRSSYSIAGTRSAPGVGRVQLRPRRAGHVLASAAFSAGHKRVAGNSTAHFNCKAICNDLVLVNRLIGSRSS